MHIRRSLFGVCKKDHNIIRDIVRVNGSNTGRSGLQVEDAARRRTIKGVIIGNAVSEWRILYERRTIRCVQRIEQAITTTHDHRPFRIEGIGKTDTRTEVILIGLDDSVATIFRNPNRTSNEVKVPQTTFLFRGWREKVIP